MVGEEVITTTTDFALELGKIGKWLQAIGIIVIIWLIVQIINFILHRKKLKSLNKIQEDLARLEKKVDKIKKK